MQDPVFIEVGYTRPFYIAPIPGAHGMVRGFYKPMLPEQSAAITDARTEPKTEKWYRKCASLIVHHLVNWSLTMKDEHCPEEIQRDITAANLLRLHPAILRRLIDIVSGYGASDMDPEWPSEEKQQHAEDELASALEDEPTTPGISALVRDTKN